MEILMQMEIVMRLGHGEVQIVLLYQILREVLHQQYQLIQQVDLVL
jgi:hypothetical protein